MRVFIAGANGGIGKILSQQLKDESEFEPVAMIRDKDQESFFSDISVETVLGDLEDSVGALSDLMSGCDALVFTAGSGGGTGYDKTLLIDLDGAAKCVEAAEAQGIDRFLMVSAINAGDREAWNGSPIKPYMAAKYYADEILIQSDIDHTILRPGGLTDEEGEGTITTTPENVSGRKIPREDVASAITECLKNDQSRNKIFEMISGDTKIFDAVASL